MVSSTVSPGGLRPDKATYADSAHLSSRLARSNDGQLSIQPAVRSSMSVDMKARDFSCRAMAVAIIVLGASALLANIMAKVMPSADWPALFPLRANAAACFVLLGGALLLVCTLEKASRYRPWVIAFSASVFVLALAGALHAIFRLGLGNGPLLPSNALPQLAANPARAALTGTIPYLLFALTLILIDSPRLRAPIHIVMVLIAAQRTFVVAAALYGAASASLPGTSTLSVSNAQFLQILLACGIVAARPGQGLAELLGVRLRHAALAGVALLFLLAITAWYWSQSQERALELQRADFARDAAVLTDALEARINTHFAVLEGITSFMETMPEHRRWPDWDRYVNRLTDSGLLPGVLSVGYAPVLRQSALESYVAIMKDSGFDRFAIRPPGNRPMYAPIAFIAPTSRRSEAAQGFDLFTEPTRSAAMHAAARSGAPTISDKVNLLSEYLVDRPHQPGFLVFVPLFRQGLPHNTPAERLAALSGFVYSPLRAGDFFKSALRLDHDTIAVRIYDGPRTDRASLLYASAPHAPVPARLQSERQVQLGNHFWTLQIYPLAVGRHGSAQNALSSAILFGGSALSLLIVSLGLALAKVGEHDRQLNETSAALARTAAALKDSNAELQRFAYVASHDLRAPLRTIGGFAAILQETAGQKLDEEERNALQYVVSSTTHLQAMIEGLLEYARVDAKPKVFAPVELNHVAEMALQMLQQAIVHSGAKVEVGPLPRVSGDSVQLVELIQNLVSNAINYRGEAAAQIRISARESNGEHVISVADNGIGIDPAHHEQIFEMFKRVHSAGDSKGTGIGLATCRRIVQRHGGRIWVESTPGAGSTFFFSLPVRAD